MKFYHYNPQSGEYLGEDTAQESPLEEDVYLVPAHATTTEPPEGELGKARIFQDDAWSLIDDQRGVQYWLADGTQHVITELGEVKPDNALDSAPPPTLEEVKAQANAEVVALFTTTRAEVSGSTDSNKLAGWADKAQRAQRVIAEQGTALDTEILQMECDARGHDETPEELAITQAMKAERLAKCIAMLDGMEAAALNTLSELSETSAIADYMVTLQTQIENTKNTLTSGE